MAPREEAQQDVHTGNADQEGGTAWSGMTLDISDLEPSTEDTAAAVAAALAGGSPGDRELQPASLHRGARQVADQGAGWAVDPSTGWHLQGLGLVRQKEHSP